MKLSIISFTQKGAVLAKKIRDELTVKGNNCTAYCMPKYAEIPYLLPLNTTLSNWTSAAFKNSDGLIFVSACGIAVRALAPHIKSKLTDPAVVVIDDCGRFAVSLLSGHMGGANTLAREIAGAVGAVPVISTATDNHHKFAVDLWAAENSLCLRDVQLAKEVSAALLDGKKVGFICDFPIDGSLPKGLCEDASLSLGICVTLDEKKKPFKNTLVLIPQSITVGIGCRKGASKEAIQTQLSACLAKEHISPLAIKEIASINIKAQEAGLLALCKEYDVPLKTYSASQLMEAKGTFSCSSFVKEQTGTDNVCERAALLASGGSLLVKKQCGKGVTIALAAANWRASFEECNT